MEKTGRGRGVDGEAHVEVTNEYRPGGEKGVNHENIWQLQRP